MIDAPETCLVLHDGRAGNRRQALALAHALGHEPREITLRPKLRARWLAPIWMPGAERALGEEFAAAWAARPPILTIGCGRQAALATRLMRTRGSRAVQILNPRMDPQRWDLVITPEHDRLAGENVLTPLGSLHPVNATWLARAHAQFAHFAQLPSPRTAVLLGGPTRAVRFDRGAFEVLATKLEYQLAQEGGSVIVCGSARTPADLAAVVRTRYLETPGVTWLDDSDGINPYAGALAWADRIVVSPDSVNMISEACATRAPVFVAEPDRATGRVRQFLSELEARGRIRAQTRDAVDFSVDPLLETPRIAMQVRLRLGLPLEEAWRY